MLKVNGIDLLLNVIESFHDLIIDVWSNRMRMLETGTE